MTTYISMLRGINLGGHKVIKMDALKEACLKLGFENVKTYIQSGNIVYQSDNRNAEELDSLIIKTIKERFGFDVPSITFGLDELKKIADLNPFLSDKVKQADFFHITFLNEMPSAENIRKIKIGDYQSDEFQIIGKAVYLYCPDGYRNTKLSNKFLENKLQTTATTRNWKTTNELIKIGESLDDL